MKIRKDYVLTNRSHLFGVMRACGLTSGEAGTILHWMRTVEQSHDIRFVVNELKRRMMCLLDSSKVHYRKHDDGTWVGSFRPVSRLAKRGRRGLRMALRICRVYGIFMAPQPSLEDYVSEAKRLAEEDPIGFPYISLRRLPEGLPRRPSIKSFDRNYPISGSKVPFEKGSLPEWSVTPAMHIQSFDSFPALALEFHGFFSKLVGPSMPDASHFEKLKAEKEDVIGNAVILCKDGGMKQRLIANVFPIIQLGLSRFHNTLYSVLRNLPNCHVFSQQEGVYWAVDRLKEGHKLSSVDLKSATDNIPLAPQIKLAKKLFPALAVDIELFERAARSPFRGGFGSIVKWNRGHPMGLKGSFPLFTLYLYALLSEYTNAFAIVGDDLIIDAEVNLDELTSTLPVNQFKSLFDSTLGEFCGQIFDRKGSLQVYKASVQNLEKDPLGLIRQYGTRALRFIYASTKKATVKEVTELNFVANLTVNDWDKLRLFLTESQVEKLMKPSYSPVSGGCPSSIKEEIKLTFPPSMRGYFYLEHPRKVFQDFLNDAIDAFERGWVHLPTIDYPPLVKQWEFAENPKSLVDLFLSSLKPVRDDGLTMEALQRQLGIKQLSDLEVLEAQHPNTSRLKRKQLVEGVLPLRFLRKLRSLYRSARTRLFSFMRDRGWHE